MSARCVVSTHQQKSPNYIHKDLSYLQNMHPDTAVAPLKKQKENNSQNKISTDSQEWDIKNVQRPIINKNSKITKFLLDSHMQVVCV